MGRKILVLLLVTLVGMPLAFGKEAYIDGSDVLVTPFQKIEQAKKEFQSWMGAQPQQVLLTDMEQPPDLASRDLVQFLKEIRTPVRLVCFGRGAADCLEALLIYPELQRNVVELVALQGEVLGAEDSEGLIDPFQEDSIKASKLPMTFQLQFLLQKFWAWLFPKPTGVYAMNPQVRATQMQKKRQQLKSLSKRLRIRSIDTSNSKYGVIPFSHELQLSQTEKNREL